MEYQKSEIKEGITLHTINTIKFKTNLIAVFITTPLQRENVTLNALIPALLRRGSTSMPTQEEISKKLEEMYGASFNCGVEKTGDNQVLKFYLETINDEYLPKPEENLKMAIGTLFSIVFDPWKEQNGFKEEYLRGEKENLKQIIEGKKDNKAKYALDRCIEEMYQNKPYGLEKYGYIEDFTNITTSNLYQYYQNLIQRAKIDIFVSGKVEKNQVQEMVKQQQQITQLKERNPDYCENSNNEIKEQKEIKTVEERMEVTQGKLVIGMDIKEESKEEKNIALVYNAILGGSATSKLFQNVREKASLAYTASSNFLRQKNSIFIRCGIEIENYEKAVEIIRKQVEDMKIGNFTNEELDGAKATVIATIKFIKEEQDTQISYYYGQELAKTQIGIEEYEQNVNAVTKEQIVALANQIQINTIYFLKD